MMSIFVEHLSVVVVIWFVRFDRAADVFPNGTGKVLREI